MDKLSLSMESYLDTVYELSDDTGEVRLTDVAARIGVTKSTANEAMIKLAGQNLILNERYRHIRLTVYGEAVAKEIANKHSVVRAFFSEILGLDDDTADTDACAIEHVISDGAVAAMRRVLDNETE
jgi:Mn-dependent DtxR family transcriptional regulator